VNGACSHVLAVNRCRSAAELQSGERLADAVDAIEQYDISGQVEAIGVNCAAPLLASPLLRAIRARSSRPLVAYPNSGEVWDEWAHGWVAVGPDGAPSAESAAAGAERFGRLARQWAADGAVLIGGCCRTRPDHIAAVARELRAAAEEGRHRHGTTLRP